MRPLGYLKRLACLVNTEVDSDVDMCIKRLIKMLGGGCVICIHPRDAYSHPSLIYDHDYCSLWRQRYFLCNVIHLKSEH